MNDKIREKLDTLPDLPGSYQMLDKDGTIIYVGKAKNLKNRVRSYFIGAHNSKTTALVSKIDDLRYIVTNTEKEAFLLEISLIKEYTPFYNIDLTDDKTYPYIEFTSEANPKLIITRKLSKKNTRYFGPYTNVVSARETMELINRIYKLRKCRTVPKKPCIYYEMGECNAPCIKKIEKEEYDEIYRSIKSLLYGNDLTVVNELKKEMLEYSSKLDFENAKKIRDLINSISATLERQDVILKESVDADIYGIAFDDMYLSVSLIYLRGGKIILSKNEIIPYYFDMDDAILSIIINNYERINPPKYVYFHENYIDIIEGLLENTELFVPQKGQKRKLLMMAMENAKISLENKNKIQIDKKRIALNELKELLDIPLPTRIESFDNSNIFGDSPVSSCVVYVNGRKSRNDYRKYKVKYVEGPNDYETMKEVVYRRYKRLLDEEGKLPDLILMDGGEIQVNACLEILDDLNLDIKVAGMKKDDKHDTSSLVYNGMEYKLDKHSELYRLLFEIQEEVHRFAITFHRSVKEKNAFKSIYDEIKGIGPVLKERLINAFKSYDEISYASDDDLRKLGLNDKTINELRIRLSEEIEFE